MAQPEVQMLATQEQPLVQPQIVVAPQPARPAAVASWTAHERKAYRQHFRVSGAPDSAKAAQYFALSALPRRALREVWAVTNPVAMSIEPAAFDAFCRLIGHCQAMEGDADMLALLREGGRPLRLFLREQCLCVPPPRLPDFSRVKP